MIIIADILMIVGLIVIGFVIGFDFAHTINKGEK